MSLNNRTHPEVQHQGQLMKFKDSDRLAIAIYNATIRVDWPFVPMEEIDRQLTGEGVDCVTASYVLIQRGFLSSEHGGAYVLSERGIAHVERLVDRKMTSETQKWQNYPTTNQQKWDAFVCHASEDKEDFVRSLAAGLKSHGLKVWFDEFSLKLGDSLRRSIDAGLAASRFGIVVISPNFMRKEWPQRELDGLVAREIAGVKVILPVWHNITSDIVRQYSPTLADKVAISSARGLERVIEELVGVIGQDRIQTHDIQ